MIPVIIDTREKVGLWRFDDEQFTTTSKKLDTGDYSIAGMEHLLCIERKKNLPEFAANITDQRFKRELDRMVMHPHRYLIIEASFDDILRFPVGTSIPKSKWKDIKIAPAFILSAISKIQVYYNIHVILAGNADNATVMAQNIIKRVYDKEKSN